MQRSTAHLTDDPDAWIPSQAERKKFLDRLRAELAVLSCLRRRVSDQSIMSLVDSRTNLLEQYLNMEDADGTIPKVAQPPRQLMQLDSMLSNIWPEAEASPGRNVVAEGKPTLNTASVSYRLSLGSAGLTRFDRQATLSVPSTPLGKSPRAGSVSVRGLIRMPRHRAGKNAEGACSYGEAVCCGVSSDAPDPR